jgi:hypothetical protein
MTTDIMERARDAAHETRITDTAEAQKLRDAIFYAARAYWEFLDRHGVIKDGQELLIVQHNDGIGCEITLQCGALDSLYPDGGMFKDWVRLDWPRDIK